MLGGLGLRFGFGLGRFGLGIGGLSLGLGLVLRFGFVIEQTGFGPFGLGRFGLGLEWFGFGLVVWVLGLCAQACARTV